MEALCTSKSVLGRLHAHLPRLAGEPASRGGEVQDAHTDATSGSCYVLGKDLGDPWRLPAVRLHDLAILPYASSEFLHV